MFDHPVIINAFSRGGSNIVWNLLLSHPRFISPLVETHQMFLGTHGAAGLGRNLSFDLKNRQLCFSPRLDGGHLMANFGALSPSNYAHRKLSDRFKESLPRIIQHHAERMLQHPYLKFKSPEETYQAGDLNQARISLKSINGTIFLTPELVQVFPDAVVMGLVRNGLALWEARSRRGTFRSAKKFGYLYCKMIEEMENQAETLPNAHVLKFEQIFEDFEAFLKQYEVITGEEFDSLESFRFKIKRHYDKSGNYVSVDDPEAMEWVPREKLFEFLNPKTSVMQIDKVAKDERDSFLSEARSVMERYGYLP